MNTMTTFNPTEFVNKGMNQKKYLNLTQMFVNVEYKKKIGYVKMQCNKYWSIQK